MSTNRSSHTATFLIMMQEALLCLAVVCAVASLFIALSRTQCAHIIKQMAPEGTIQILNETSSSTSKRTLILMNSVNAQNYGSTHLFPSPVPTPKSMSVPTANSSEKNAEILKDTIATALKVKGLAAEAKEMSASSADSEHPAPDGGKGIDAPLINTNAHVGPSSDAPDAPAEPVILGQDPIEAKFGSFFFVSDGKVDINARAVAAKFLEKVPVAFNESEKSFYNYGPAGVWLRISKVEVVRQMEQFVLELLALVNSALIPAAKFSQVKAVVDRMQYDQKMEAPPLPHRCLIAVKNGVLDLSGGSPQLRPHSKDYWFTHCIPVDYIPDAAADCFEKQLLEPAMANAEDRALLQRDLGRMLFAGNSAQSITLLIGKGGSGKSVLTAVLERMLGYDQMAYLRTEMLSGRFETQSFSGKTCLMAKDVSPTFLLARGAQLLKSLTGADLMQSEQKYKGKSHLVGDFYVMVTANSSLTVKIQGDEEAWRRRLIIHHFSRETVPDRIAKLDEYLINEEGSGILRWLIAGLQAHRAELSEHGRFMLTPQQQRRVENMLAESSSATAFVKECLETGDGSLTVDEIFRAYCNYCDGRGWRVISSQEFSTELPKLMETYHHVKRRHDIHGSKRGFKGIMFIGDAAVNEPMEESSNPETRVLEVASEQG